MSLIKRLSLALLLALSLSPAFGQVPPPVPALPDAERRTSYSITATTCACAVNFALYGDSTDYQNWVEVFLNGIRVNFNDPNFGWTITTPSGSFATLARPVSNAILTFNAVQTGTVQIVGARRPRRTSQFNEGTGVPTRNLNLVFSDLTAQTRELWDKTNDFTGRGLFGLPGEAISPMPSASARAGGFLCWDGTGLVPLACAPGTSTGNVSGPNSSVDGHIALFNGITGRIIKDGGVPGTGTVTGPVSSTNGGFAKWNGTTGLVLQDGPATIPLANGGTNAALTASLGGLVYSTGSAFAVLSGTATANQIPLSGASAAPAWSTATYPATTTINQLLWSSGANTIAGLATANNGTLITSAGGVPSISSTLPTAVQGNITTLGTIATGVWNGSTIGLVSGGTGQTTALAARAGSGLNVESFSGVGNTNYSILTTDRTVGTNAVFTGSHTWTLPLANSVNPGQQITVADFQGTITGSNTLVITRGGGGDTVNGLASITLAVANGGYILQSDGISKWTALAIGAASAGGVSSITCGTGLSGGTITTTGTCAVNLSILTNSLGADVALSNISNYFPGPSVAQGVTGTWWASGTVTVSDSVAAAAQIWCKLWDGTTIISSSATRVSAAGTSQAVALSGYLASPAGNIRIDCKDITATTGAIQFNVTGNSKDSTLSVSRVQ